MKYRYTTLSTYCNGTTQCKYNRLFTSNIENFEKVKLEDVKARLNSMRMNQTDSTKK